MHNPKPRLIAIGGEPATGKSALMQRLITYLGPSGEPLVYETLRGTFYPSPRVILLGRYDDTMAFNGTDRLSMSVSTVACQFIATYPYFSWQVLFEGDRLFNRSFLRCAYQYCDPRLFLLCADPLVLARRHRERGDTQTTTWLRAQETKYAHLSQEFAMARLKNNTPDDMACAIHIIWNELTMP